MGIMICPVCGKELKRDEKRLFCPNGHSFDLAKEGYVNLLTGSKRGDKTGDSKESARARHIFLQKGYFSFLKEEISSKLCGTVLDICCGEGYYDDYDGRLYGFDLSKEMARLAAKRKNGGFYFVANLKEIPVKSESIDTAIHIFAPFNAKEFARILKKLVYETPYLNDENHPDGNGLQLISKQKISRKALIPREDLKTLFSMTPYFYRTSERDRENINVVDALETTLSFTILEYKKEE